MHFGCGSIIVVSGGGHLDTSDWNTIQGILPASSEKVEGPAMWLFPDTLMRTPPIEVLFFASITTPEIRPCGKIFTVLSQVRAAISSPFGSRRRRFCKPIWLSPPLPALKLTTARTPFPVAAPFFAVRRYSIFVINTFANFRFGDFSGH